MNPADEKKILIIAGPNGTGKTTFAEEYLSKEAACPIFVNADLIAAGLSPFGRLQGGSTDAGGNCHHVRQGHSFAFETTLSGRFYAQQIPQWRQLGYHVKLFFLCLVSVELAVQRVQQRVLAGGHDVAEPVIRRRFDAGWRHFNNLYKPLVNEWALYDNSGPIPILLDEGVNP